MTHAQYIASAEHIGLQQVENTLALLADGATIPFIARYRKERTQSLDEVQIEAIARWRKQLAELDKRRQTILESIEQQGALNPALRSKIEGCWSATELEDLYLPFKPKRKTRASRAREAGLEPLAKQLMQGTGGKPQALAAAYLNQQIITTDEALQGARDIVAEWVNEDERARQIVRHSFAREAIIRSKVIKGKEADASKYADYFDFSEKLARIASHRLLALRRGEAEGFLRISIAPETDSGLERLQKQFVRPASPSAEQVQLAVNDAYKRLLEPSIETEFDALSKGQADKQAIGVFAENLRQLLLSAPLGSQRVLAIDPGYRTGCKLACLDEQGGLLHYDTIYPHPPQSDTTKAAQKLDTLCRTYGIVAIAIGNGTASRETEQFVRSLHFQSPVRVFVVSEAGASIYSASKIARDEFPDHDVTVRGAVSIGRRLMDPLAELVKIEPKSLGVGQYQHDVDQKALKESLDYVVESCVNHVGVDLNTASQHLLTYVSGLGPQLAHNIVDYRAANGPFRNRKQLMKVPRMGAKSFEQAAGFLRIPQSENPLDNTSVHPEAYPIVERMARDLGVDIGQLIANEALRKRIDPQRYVTDSIGLPTLADILRELDKPGRDPRQQAQELHFDDTLRSIDQLHEGMVLPGIVTNVTNFGAFVDIGLKENGLVHVSQLREGYVSDPASVVKLHQHVRVRVLSVDVARKRIQLSMRNTQ